MEKFRPLWSDGRYSVTVIVTIVDVVVFYYWKNYIGIGGECSDLSIWKWYSGDTWDDGDTVLILLIVFLLEAFPTHSQYIHLFILVFVVVDDDDALGVLLIHCCCCY
jgi:hypothetical protein